MARKTTGVKAHKRGGRKVKAHRRKLPKAAGLKGAKKRKVIKQRKAAFAAMGKRKTLFKKTSTGKRAAALGKSGKGRKKGLSGCC